MRNAIIWVLALQLSLYAVVTVEPVDPGDTVGFSGEADGAFKESSGNIKRKDYSGGARLQYDYPDRTDFVVGNALYAESKGEVIEKNSFLHYRHLESLSESSVWEFYAQNETNDFINLSLRQLAGMGPRYRFFGSESVRLYFGIGAYASIERYALANGEIEEYKNRANAYLSYKQKKSKEFEAGATAYYQPAIDDVEDYYLVANGYLKLFITQKLHMKLSAGTKEDTHPFEGNKRFDSYYILGFGYTF